MPHNVDMRTLTTLGVCSVVATSWLVSTCQAPLDSKSHSEPVTYQFENRDAWKLENDRLRISILHGSGHIAEIVLKNASGDSVNLLWVRPWPSIDPGTFDAAKHGSIYGTNST